MTAAPSRRVVLKAVGATSALVWVAPAVTTVSSVAATGSSPVLCTDPPECAEACEHHRRLFYASDEYYGNLAGSNPAMAAFFNGLRAENRDFYVDALAALGCCPLPP